MVAPNDSSAENSRSAPSTWLARFLSRRTLLAIVVAMAGIIVAVPLLRARSAVATIHGVGGKYECRQWGPRWFRSAIGEWGDGTLFRVSSVDLSNTTITDEDFAALARFCLKNDVQHFSLWGTSITSASCASLAEIQSLRVLDLSDTEVDDDGIAALAELKQLERLSVAGTDVGDEGVSRLITLTHLQELDLDHTSVGDRGIAALGQLPNLKEVSCANTDVTDEGLTALREQNADITVWDD